MSHPSNDEPFVDAVCRVAQAGRLALFVGAGISKPSGLPTSSEMVTTSIAQLISELNDSLSCVAAFPANYGRIVRLEYFCHSLGEINAKASLLPLQLLVGGAPSTLHYFLASCLQKGMVQTIITTNFDCLIEAALDDLAVPYRSIFDEADLARFTASSPGVTLIKLHGTLDRRTGIPVPGILADIHSVGKGLSAARIKALQAAVTRYSFLVLGYSGRDHFGAMPVFFSTKTRPIYWLNHGGSLEADSDAVIRRWVTHATNGLYLNADTHNVVNSISSRLRIALKLGSPTRMPHSVIFGSRLSDFEKAFALSFLYSRNPLSDTSVIHSSFKDCERLFLRSKDTELLGLGRLYLQWVRTLERFGRTPRTYANAISLLEKALPLVDSHEVLSTDVAVALCDMQYCQTYLAGGSGMEYLSLAEMLIDRSAACMDPILLSRAYLTKARILQNSFHPKSMGYPMALECYDRAASVLEPLGAQEALFLTYFEQFKLAVLLGSGAQAARAVVSCLRSALLFAPSTNDETINVLRNYIAEFVSDNRFSEQRGWVENQLALMGFGYSSPG